MPGVTLFARTQITHIARSSQTTAILGCCLALVASTTFAQLPAPQLTSVFPPGGKQGATVDVTLGAPTSTKPTSFCFRIPGFRRRRS